MDNYGTSRANASAEDPAAVYGGIYTISIEGESASTIMSITDNLNLQIDRLENFRIWIYDVADEAKKTGITSEDRKSTRLNSSH